MNEQYIFTIQRFLSESFGTAGKLYNPENKLIGYTLELPYKENKRNISSIIEGLFPIVSRETEKRGRHLHIINVPNRMLILFHAGNVIQHTRGCILPANELQIGKNFIVGKNSKAATEQLNKEAFNLLDSGKQVFLKVINPSKML